MYVSSFRYLLKSEQISVCESDGVPRCAELKLTFGDDEESQQIQQLVWSAWRGEASNSLQLIGKQYLEFMTSGTLYLPKHAPFWEQLCGKKGFFTAEAYAVVQAVRERCLQGASSGMHPQSVDMPFLHGSAYRTWFSLASFACFTSWVHVRHALSAEHHISEAY